jgi:secretion/DNA translocation related TadE-like protein
MTGHVDTREGGSASIWVLACATLVLLVGLAGSLRTAAVLGRHRAESAADFAALAAAGRIGVATDGCTVARSIAAANGARLVRCQMLLNGDGRSGTVEVAISLSMHLGGYVAQPVIASARAGRLATTSSAVWHDGRQFPAATASIRAEAKGGASWSFRCGARPSPDGRSWPSAAR